MEESKEIKEWKELAGTIDHYAKLLFGMKHCLEPFQLTFRKHHNVYWRPETVKTWRDGVPSAFRGLLVDQPNQHDVNLSGSCICIDGMKEWKDTIPFTIGALLGLDKGLLFDVKLIDEDTSLYKTPVELCSSPDWGNKHWRCAIICTSNLSGSKLPSFLDDTIAFTAFMNHAEGLILAADTRNTVLNNSLLLAKKVIIDTVNEQFDIKEDKNDKPRKEN